MNVLIPESERHLSLCRMNVFAVISIIIIVLSIYANTFHASWHLDDEQNILDRKEIHLTRLDWPGIKKTFYGKSGEIYRPVACLSFALNYYFGKKDVSGYHMINIAIHCITGIFLFLFLHRTLKLPNLNARYGPDAYSISLLSVILWAMNPIQIQAVTYIVQRMASMAGMFYIIAMYFYLKARISEKKLAKSAYFLICLFSGILAFGSKENAAMLPISILLYDLFLIQGVNKKSIIRNSCILLVLILIPLALALLLRGPSTFQPEDLLIGYDYRSFSMIERILTESRIIFLYISLLLYPMPDRLSIAHDISISHNLIDPFTTILSISGILVITSISLIKSKKWPFLSYCVVFFFVNHLIESSILPLELIFEHRNYIPSMLFFVPIAILILKGFNYYSQKKLMQGIIAVFVTLALIGLGHSTYVRNHIWKTDESLWIDAAEKAPDLLRPLHNLANYYSSHNRRHDALPLFLKALSKKSPHNTAFKCITHYNIGLEYQRLGQYDEALTHYRESEKTCPHFGDLFNNRGLIFMEKGMFEKARHDFERATNYYSPKKTAYINLGSLLLKNGSIAEAIQHLEIARKNDPENIVALFHLGYAYRLGGSYGKALTIFEKILQSKHPDARVLLFLAEIYFIRGQNDYAEKLIKRFSSSGKESDLHKYIEGDAINEEKSEMVRSLKCPVLKRLHKEYSKKVSMIADIEKINNNVSK